MSRRLNIFYILLYSTLFCSIVLCSYNISSGNPGLKVSKPGLKVSNPGLKVSNPGLKVSNPGFWYLTRDISRGLLLLGCCVHI